MWNALTVILIVGTFPLMHYVANAQTKDAPAPSDKPKAQQGPERKPGVAATVGQPAPPATVVPETYASVSGQIAQLEAAIVALKAGNAASKLIADTEATLAERKAKLATMTKPTVDPFNPAKK